VALQIYKPGQGRYVRLGTVGGAALVALIICYYVWTLMVQYLPKEFAYRVYVAYAVPAVLFAAIALVVALYLNRPKAADFFIATESEMKKVAWSSKAELIGSTTVVIVTVVLLAVFIYVADTVVLVTMQRVLHLW